MRKNSLTQIVLIVLAGFLLVQTTGCENKAQKEELQKLKDNLAKAAGEKDTLSAEVTKITDTLKNTKTELESMIQSRDSLQKQVETFTAKITEMETALQNVTKEAADAKGQIEAVVKEKDAALAKGTEAQTLIDQLKTQVQEQAKKIDDYAAQIKKFQDTINEMKKKLTDGLTPPAAPAVPAAPATPGS